MKYNNHYFELTQEVHVLLKQWRPAGDESRLPGEPKHSHQNEEDARHDFRIAVQQKNPNINPNINIKS